VNLENIPILSHINLLKKIPRWSKILLMVLIILSLALIYFFLPGQQLSSASKDPKNISAGY